MITKAESEVRIFILLSIFAFALNTLFLICIYHMLIITMEPNLENIQILQWFKKFRICKSCSTMDPVNLCHFRTQVVHSSFSFCKQDFYLSYIFRKLLYAHFLYKICWALPSSKNKQVQYKKASLGHKQYTQRLGIG